MRRSLLLLAALLLLLPACGGGEKAGPTGPVDPGNPTGEGIVKSVEGSAKPTDEFGEGKGGVVFDVSHTDRLVNKSVEIDVKDASGNTVGKVAGNEPLTLAPGTYSAVLDYDENDLVKNFAGTLSGLVVHPGHLTTYRVGVEAPIGVLKMRFSDGEENLSEQVTLTVYNAGDDPELVVGPVWEGPASETVMLPSGAYKVRAVFKPEKGNPITEWYKDVELGEALARNERDVVLELDLTGLRVDVFNYGRDINDHSRVYIYNEGADVAYAVALFQGKAGEAIPADPGVYDVRVVYTPSRNSLDFVGDKVLPGIKVNAGLGSRIQADVELPLATLRVKVTDGDTDISDKTEIRVMRTGADKTAASPLVDEVGVGTHPIPVGAADITLWAPKTEGGARRTETFKGVTLENGWAWEQEFDVAAATWTPTEPRKPTSELKPITWVQPGDDDDSAGDDDDSARGDDDDSAKAAKPTAEATPAPAAP